MVTPSKDLEESIKNAADTAKSLNHEYVTTEHVLYSMLSNQGFVDIINGFGSNASTLRKTVSDHLINKSKDITSADTVIHPKKTASFERMMNKAFTQVIFNNRQVVEITDAFLMIMNEKRSWAFYYIQKAEIDKDKFADYLNNTIDEEDTEVEQDPGSNRQIFGNGSPTNKHRHGTGSTTPDDIFFTFCIIGHAINI